MLLHVHVLVRILTVNDIVTLQHFQERLQKCHFLPHIPPPIRISNRLLLFIDWRLDVPLGILDVTDSKLDQKTLAH